MWKESKSKRERERLWSKVPLPHTALQGRPLWSREGPPPWQQRYWWKGMNSFASRWFFYCEGREWMEQGGGRQGDLFVILIKMDDFYSQCNTCCWGSSAFASGGLDEGTKLWKWALLMSVVCVPGSKRQWAFLECASTVLWISRSAAHLGQSKSLAFKYHTYASPTWPSCSATAA